MDAPFGSCGSAFALHPEAGAYLANPPFDPALIGALSSERTRDPRPPAALVARGPMLIGGLTPAGHLGELLTRADASRSPLAFVVVMPHWPERACWRDLVESRHARHVWRIEAAEHGYLDGGAHHARACPPHLPSRVPACSVRSYVSSGQHYRPGLWRPASNPTSVIVLQSDAAAVKRPIGAKTERRLRAAFRTPVKPLGGEADHALLLDELPPDTDTVPPEKPACTRAHGARKCKTKAKRRKTAAAPGAQRQSMT